MVRPDLFCPPPPPTGRWRTGWRRPTPCTCWTWCVLTCSAPPPSYRAVADWLAAPDTLYLLDMVRPDLFCPPPPPPTGRWRTGWRRPTPCTCWTWCVLTCSVPPPPSYRAVADWLAAPDTLYLLDMVRPDLFCPPPPSYRAVADWLAAPDTLYLLDMVRPDLFCPPPPSYRAVADWLAAPDTLYLLDMVRPDLFCPPPPPPPTGRWRTGWRRPTPCTCWTWCVLTCCS